MIEEENPKSETRNPICFEFRVSSFEFLNTMYIAIPAILAIGPSLLLVWYYYRQDKRKPEPKGLIVKIFLLGLVVTFPVIIVELLVSTFEKTLSWFPLLFHFFRAFVVAALCEEWFKLQVVMRFAYRNIHFDEVMDGIVYTIVASLGFACMENILYVIDRGTTVAIMRAFTAVPMHALASGMMGYYVGRAKFAEEQERSDHLISKGLWIGILIHGTYDFILFTGSYYFPLLCFAIFPLIIWIFFLLRRKIKSAIADDIEAGRDLDIPPLIIETGRDLDVPPLPDEDA